MVNNWVQLIVNACTVAPLFLYISSVVEIKIIERFALLN